MESTKPSYYKAGVFDVIAFCHHHGLSFAIGNVVKYAVRAGKKEDTLLDLLKAREYLDREIAHVEKWPLRDCEKCRRMLTRCECEEIENSKELF